MQTKLYNEAIKRWQVYFQASKLIAKKLGKSPFQLTLKEISKELDLDVGQLSNWKAGRCKLVSDKILLWLEQQKNDG